MNVQQIIQKGICILVFLMLPFFCDANTFFEKKFQSQPSMIFLSPPSQEIQITETHARQLKGSRFESMTEIQGIASPHQFFVVNTDVVTFSNDKGAWNVFLPNPSPNEITISFPSHFLAYVQVKNANHILSEHQDLVVETIMTQTDYPLLLTYTIINPNGEEVWKYVMDQEVNPASSFTIFLQPPSSLAEGTYQVIVRYLSENVLYTSTDIFEYEMKKEVTSTSFSSLVILCMVLFCLCILGIFLWVLKPR